MYAVKKYLVSYMQEKIERDYKEQKALANKTYSIKKNEEVLRTCMMQEKTAYEELRSKIALWRAVVQQEQHEVLQKKESAVIHVYEQRLEQRHNKDIHVQLILIAKEVACAVEKEVKQEYSNDLLVRQFTQYSIDQLYNEK